MNSILDMDKEEVQKRISLIDTQMRNLKTEKLNLLGILNLIEKNEKINCIVCRDTGRAYLSEGIFGDCLDCEICQKK